VTRDIDAALASDDPSEWVGLLNEILQEDRDRRRQETDWPELVAQARACNPAPLYSALCSVKWKADHADVEAWLSLVSQLSQKRGRSKHPVRRAVKAWRRHQAQSIYAAILRAYQDMNRAEGVWLEVVDLHGIPVELRYSSSIKEATPLWDSPSQSALSWVGAVLNISSPAAKKLLFHR
jgi:hypothetical protein